MPPRKKTSQTDAPPTPENGGGAPQQPSAPQGKVVGELSEGEHNTLKMLQEQAGGLLAQIGRLERTKLQLLTQGQDLSGQVGQVEVQKARVLGQYSEVSGKAQHVLNEAAKRMAIPEGQTWQVTPEGKAIIFENTPGAPPPQ